MRSPASTQPKVSLKTDGSRAPPLASTLAHCFSLSAPFHRRQQSVTRLSQEHDDQNLTDPRTHLVLHIAWQSLSEATHEFHPTGHGIVSAHLKFDLYIVGIRVTYVTSPMAARADLRHTAPQVVLQLAYALEVTPDTPQVSLQDSVAPHNTSFRPVERDNSPLLSTSCWDFVLSLYTLHLPFIQPPVDLACSRSIIFLTTSIVTRPRTGSWWSCPLFLCSSCVAPSSKSPHHTRFCRSPQLQCDAQTTPLSRGVCTNAAPQKPNKNTVKCNISVDGVHTASLASEVIDASQSAACRCCTWNCSLSSRNRRHHDSQRMDTRVAGPSAALIVKWYTWGLPEEVR